MFRDDFALAIKLDGTIQPEVNGEVVVPFDTDFQIRLRNKSRLRALVDVSVNGELAGKGIVLSQNEPLDLERYVGIAGSSDGKTFRLVPLKDKRVDQPHESQNGLIKARFYPEIVKQVREEIIHTYEHHHHYCGNLLCPICYPQYPKYPTHPWPHPWIVYTSNNTSGANVNMTWTANSGGAVGGLSSSFSCDSNLSPCRSVSKAQDGAVVPGVQSSQQFTTVHMEADMSKGTVLTLKLKGIQELKSRCICGYKRKKERFCPNCGRKLMRV